ncbi:MAG: hypothetical protein ACRDTX_11075 [Pseudonocardiaceae bacterium]
MTDRHPDGDMQRLMNSPPALNENVPALSENDRRLATFVADLRRLRSDAGQPSFRKMSSTACYSHTALSGALSGGRLPSLDLTLAFVRACGGDEEVWRARWTAENVRINPALTSDPTAGPDQRLRRIPRAALAAITISVVVLAGAVALTVVALHSLGRAPAMPIHSTNGLQINYYSHDASEQCTTGKNQNGVMVSNCTQLRKGSNPDQGYWWVGPVTITWYHPDHSSIASTCVVPKSQDGDSFTCYEPS